MVKIKLIKPHAEMTVLIRLYHARFLVSIEISGKRIRISARINDSWGSEYCHILFDVVVFFEKEL